MDGPPTHPLSGVSYWGVVMTFTEPQNRQHGRSRWGQIRHDGLRSEHCDHREEALAPIGEPATWAEGGGGGPCRAVLMQGGGRGVDLDGSEMKPHGERELSKQRRRPRG